jgi:two-component system NarL family sensor kinase
VHARIAPARPVRRALLAYGLSAGLTLVVVWIGAVVASGYIARAETLHDAETTADRLGRLVVAPLLLGTDADGGGSVQQDIDRAVALRRQDGFLLRIEVWQRDGVVVYSDRPDAVGRGLPVPSAVEDAIDRDTVTSWISEEPEPGPMKGLAPLIEVAEPLHLRDRTVALIAYLNYDRIDRTGELLVGQITPLTIGAPLLLQLLQLPVIMWLGRRLVRQEADRSALLERALSASERERRAIAGDLHDGVLQQLAGAGFVVASLPPWIEEPTRAVAAERAAATITAQVDALRRLAVTIYPPDLTAPGLPASIEALATPLRTLGVHVTVEARPLPELDPVVTATLYRVARECLSNVAQHASAGVVRVCLRPSPDGGNVSLCVVDDGVGIAETTDTGSDQTHLGLRLLTDRVADIGGELRVESGRPGGTVVEVVVPPRPRGPHVVGKP